MTWWVIVWLVVLTITMGVEVPHCWKCGARMDGEEK